jgi:predicted nucleic acid-binding protein
MKLPYKKTCLIDTNILVAYFNASHVHHAVARTVIQGAIDKKFAAVISSQNIVELTAVELHGWKIDRKTVAKHIDILKNDPSLTPLYPDARVMQIFQEHISKYPTLHTMDLYLLATALAFKIDMIITIDSDFRAVKEPSLTILNPITK